MSEGWHVVIENATGEAVSMGTLVAHPLRDGLGVVELSAFDAAALLEGRGVWVASTRSVRPCVPPVPDVTTEQLRSWMGQTLGMSTGEIDDAFREAARIA